MMRALYLYGKSGAGKVPEGARFFPDADAALMACERESAESVLIAEADSFSCIREAPRDSNSFDLLHAGLCAEGACFQSLPLVSISWRFIDPCAHRRCTSWKATTSACILKPAAVRAMGGFDWAYQSPDARLMDLAYRLNVRGGRIAHDPALVAPESRLRRAQIPLEDEFLFMHRHVHRLAPLFAAFWFTLQEGFRSGCATARKRAAAAVKAGPKPEMVEDGSSSLSLTAAAPRQKVTSISAIIPTINRYDYIVGSIDSLRNQTPRPDEIIVVDQTPRAQRRPEVYEKYADTEVRVIFMDSAGQSTSRNLAIEDSRSEWCLFFEDDAEAWADCLAQHIDLLEASGADASTGVSLAPWKTAANIPVAIRHYHLADVLATGNCLARRSAILDVGGLDTAFDRGSGADHDLGARMYLRGHEVVFNPKAIETHFKAPSGGMRTYGAWWRNKTTMWAPYPPPTQIYTIHQYYPKRYWAPLYLHYFIQAGGRNRGAQLFWLWLSAPWKLYKAIRAAGRLTHQLGWQVGDREPGASRLQEKVPLR